MLIFNLKNYDDFKEVFGLRECNNGNVSRKNKILLACLKNREFVRWCLKNEPEIIKSRNIADFKNHIYRILANRTYWIGDCVYWSDGQFTLENGMIFPQNEYHLDERRGVCYDGDCSAVRYVRNDNDEEYKMRAGKWVTKSFECTDFGSIIPEQIVRYIGEDFTNMWVARVQEITDGEYELYVGEDRSDFEKIYDGDNYYGNFHSCMTNNDQHDFYYDAVSAKAAWLEKDETIYARCIIFTDVMDDEGNTYRLAERQYSSNLDNTLKQLLVNKLISAGEIDGYKQVGADCHSPRAFVSNSGESWSDKNFHIRCYLEDGDTMSYQDTFKYYDLKKNIAYNYRENGADFDLSETESTFSVGERYWSEYNNEYLTEDEAYYDEVREDYFYRNQVVEDIHGNWRYEGDMTYCEECGRYFDNDCEGWHSDVTDADYCCRRCMEEAEERYKESNWYYSDWDEDYYEHLCEMKEMYIFERNGWKVNTIHEDSLQSLIDDEEVFDVDGKYYYADDDDSKIAVLKMQIALLEKENTDLKSQLAEAHASVVA